MPCARRQTMLNQANERSAGESAPLNFESGFITGRGASAGPLIAAARRRIYNARADISADAHKAGYPGPEEHPARLRVLARHVSGITNADSCAPASRPRRCIDGAHANLISPAASRPRD